MKYDDGFDVWTHVFVISLRVIAEILTEVATYTALDKYDKTMSVSNWNFMFQHDVPRET